MRHEPVLIHETIEAMNLRKGGRVIDCTLGDGGHAEAILEAIGPKGKLLGIDADPESLLRAKRFLYRFGEQVVYARDNFENLSKIIVDNNFGLADAILMDLGWSSPQFEERNRGFSFERDEPLDMRYTPVNGSETTAEKIINEWNVKELEEIFRRFGEEDLSKEIAEAIDAVRKVNQIKTTRELAEIILQVYRSKLKTEKEIPWIGGIHPATKVFQALRIAVNRELEVLKQALPQAYESLAGNGRLAVITFHSLEDRIVKHYFQTLSSGEAKLITAKPITAGEAELEANRRSRSAKLRVIEKI
ncbi:MAG: 16S rRNA (cytosine(1402)-N(4))-methyltransferase RsmH [Patescibacteria group bacterium]